MADARSPYATTPIINKYITYLDVWDYITINPSDDDELITLDSKYNQRPDLLAYNYYGDVRLWWVFAVRNPNVLIDPVYDLTTNTEIYIPSRASLGI